MGSDPAVWALARLADFGNASLTPSAQGPGRFSDLRLVWAVKVRSALEDVASLRAAAACSAIDPESAVDMLRRADAVEIHGPDGAAVSTKLTEESARELYREHTGIDWSKREDMDRVYAAVAAMRTNEANEAAVRAQAQRETAAKSRGAGHGSGKVRPPR